MVKVNLPENDPEHVRQAPAPYNEAKFGEEEALRRVVACAGRMPLLVSGGAREDIDDVLHKARIALRAGATGIIFGRNIWQRSYDDALALSRQIHEVIREHAMAAAL
jgi:class I fructose-bisphosphate aldolase